MAESYIKQARFLEERALKNKNFEGATIDLLKFILSNEQVAIKAQTPFFRKRKLAEIAAIRAEALELSKGFIEPYDELKTRWEKVSEPKYVFTSEFDETALQKNCIVFRDYVNSIAEHVGGWFYTAKFANDPYAFIIGEAMAPINMYTVTELLSMNDRNIGSFYPEHATWAKSLPYGAYLIREWFGLMSLNRGGLFDSYVAPHAKVHIPSPQLRELVRELVGN